jgi:hypothetical protein
VISTIRYLASCPDLELVLGGDDDGNYTLNLFTDASFAIHADGKSHGGINMKFQLGSFAAKSSTIKVVAKSVAEAELITNSDGVDLASWGLQFLEGQGYILPKAFVYEDNQATIALALNGGPTSERSRHIRSRFFFIKQFINSGEMTLNYCPTELMIADILTKPLKGEMSLKMRDLLLGRVRYGEGDEEMMIT